MRRKQSLCLGLTGVLALQVYSGLSLAQLPEDQIARLGTELTCLGAIKAGNAEGTIPEFSGKWSGAPDGIDPKASTHPQDPYANEQPLFVITAETMDRYAEHLSAGQKALFKQYPDTFRMPVYPTHRDFSYNKGVCDATLENARIAKLVNNGEGIEGRAGGVMFPIPQSAEEIRMNATMGGRYAWTEDYISDNAYVLKDGNVNWGRVHSRNSAPGNQPNKVIYTKDLAASSYYSNLTLLPLRDKGEVNNGIHTWDYVAKPSQSWRYDPGTRRVRQSPGYGYDMSFPGTGGSITVDEVRIFNGSGQRYDWKIIGKQELFIPANNYKIHAKTQKYADMLTPNHINPDVMRYELRRVWVIQATLKEGYRHLYAKRDLYIDEDSWMPVMGDNYDTRGGLWRTSMLNTIHLPELEGWQAGVGLYHDLEAGTYLAFNLINEQRRGYWLNRGDVSPGDFGPEAARRAGQ
ncbi:MULTISPECIES: DUF1329 domain-containing protein [unclassified Pseudomonas]|uniref:DUF1329 domain-containing protein n=1 Tax=unclassified Pseudomonas TaxID=196821 RepID=UPI00103D199E|nr:DUF1329 domain-containing protein [Pseudomonas sp. IC_126]TCD21338.1 DUF1329 domain-containing protein [Pseudomonas sp. IC_126]